MSMSMSQEKKNALQNQLDKYIIDYPNFILNCLNAIHNRDPTIKKDALYYVKTVIIGILTNIKENIGMSALQNTIRAKLEEHRSLYEINEIYNDIKQKLQKQNN